MAFQCGSEGREGRLVWFVRVQSLYAKGLRAEDALVRVKCRAHRISEITVNAAKLSVLVLFLGSVALTTAGFSLNLNQPLSAIGIVLVVLTIVPVLLGVLQTLEQLWPNAPIPDAPIKGYRRVFEGLNRRFTQYIERRMTGRVLARYGSQKLAQEILTADEAEKFTVASYVQRRRRRGLVALAVCALAIAGGGISDLALANHSTPNYKIGQQIMLDSIFSATVLTSPACALSKAFGEAAPLCSVEVRFRNISDFPSLLGPGSFTSVGPNGIDESSAPYAVSLLSHGKNHNFYDAPPSGGDIEPDQTATFNLYFWVPTGIHPDELLLKSEVSGTSVRVDFP